MRVAFAEDVKRQDSGKHKFLHRLASVLPELGVKVVSNRSDILLHIGRLPGHFVAKKVILRLDGLWFNKAMDYNKLNQKILKKIINSHGIIYQGPFCRAAFARYFDVSRRHACILNGADPREFPPRDPQNFFLATCNWRPHKRLRSICEGFALARDRGLDADLLIAGEPNETIRHPNIKYLGWVKPRKMRKLLSRAISTVHLAWIDWCPNAMVESIVAGCPVIYTDSGGSGDVGNGAGIAIADTQWDFRPCYHYKPPDLSLGEIADAMLCLKATPRTVARADLHIQNVAKQYVEFFEACLND